MCTSTTGGGQKSRVGGTREEGLVRLWVDSTRVCVCGAGVGCGEPGIQQRLKSYADTLGRKTIALQTGGSCGHVCRDRGEGNGAKESLHST